MGRILFTSLLLTAMHAQADLVISNAHVRAMPPGQPNTAAFLTLKNTGKDAVTLVSASTTAAKKAEYHQHTMSANGVMSMSQVPSITIAAGKSFEFKTGAHHIMLLGLTHHLTPGEQIDLSLQDQQGHSYTYDIPVVSIMDMKPMNGEHQHHHDHQE